MKETEAMVITSDCFRLPFRQPGSRFKFRSPSSLDGFDHDSYINHENYPYLLDQALQFLAYFNQCCIIKYRSCRPFLPRESQPELSPPRESLHPPCPLG